MEGQSLFYREEASANHETQINSTRWNVMLCLVAFNAGFATAIMVYTNIQAARSVTFDPDYKPPSGTYDKGWFTLEAWTCQVQSSFPDYHKEQFTTQCAGERGSRILIVLVWLLSLGVLGALVWDVKSSKKILCVERRKTMWEEEEEDGEEFDGEMEMK
ncbi:hypothetical protein C1H76_5850 [Elsinoe australis]|uniref:Uncharacterized protein n=1 Tax=Elsinoe australis TaxID=40998 RepID=A0A4U7B3P1_9PEZI|nr:hypothetical protein C1H76_5850 [Elsinoe australis]